MGGLTHFEMGMKAIGCVGQRMTFQLDNTASVKMMRCKNSSHI